MEDLEEIAVVIRDAVRHLPNKLQENNKKLKDIELERCDLNHYAEFVNLNARDGYKFYKEKQELENRRRKLKEENDQLKFLVPVLKSYRNKIQQLDQAVGQIRRLKKDTNNKSYTCRIRKDLQPHLDKVWRERNESTKSD